MGSADPLAHMSFVLYTLTAIKPLVLPSVLGTIDDLLGGSDAKEWSAISAALHRYASHSIAPSEINATEALRLGKIDPSARLAVLLWHLSNENTRSRLARHIAPDIETLWDCGFSVSSVLIQFLQQWDKRVPVEQFLGSRSSVPAGTLESVRVAQVTYPLAEQILSRPQDWPTDLVRAAVDRLVTDSKRKTPSCRLPTRQHRGRENASPELIFRRRLEKACALNESAYGPALTNSLTSVMPSIPCIGRGCPARRCELVINRLGPLWHPAGSGIGA